MVNSKKMNKSTVAVIVLALLLVLSLILTATGAWFTDKTESKDNSANISWGTIAIKYTDSDDANNGVWVDKTGTTKVTKVLPGDKLSFAGNIAFDTTTDAKVYMLVKISNISVEEALKQYLVVSDVTLKVDGAALTAVEGVTADEGYAFYLVDTTKTVAVAGGISVADETPNYVGSTQLNGGADITLTYGLEVSIIQSHNIEAQVAYDTLKAGVLAKTAA